MPGARTVPDESATGAERGRERPDPRSPRPRAIEAPGGARADLRRIEKAEALAADIARTARATTGVGEAGRRRRVAALVDDEDSRDLLLDLTDQVLRIHTPRRAAASLAGVVGRHPHPAMAGPLDRAALRLAGPIGRVAPGVVVPAATARLRYELRTLVLPASRPLLRRHLARRRAAGIRLNVNLLGEAVLGERQANERLAAVAALLARREVECVSIKLSALDSQLDVLAYRHSLSRVAERLRPLLVAAAGQRPPKLVYLDMEEYRDLHLTVDAFTELLADPALATASAGIALQAYLPDSADVLEALCTFARRRHRANGASLRVRLVKGANLAMERVEAELRGWAQAPYATKEEVDANYKRLLDIALHPHNAGAVQVGVASHNLFDVAWALVRAEEAGRDRVEIEMLEGMAVPEAVAVAGMAGSVLLYAPVVRRGDFESAVAYLVRRFDENTAPENFLAHAASLEPGSRAWQEQRERFRRAVTARHEVARVPRRVATLAPKPVGPGAEPVGPGAEPAGPGAEPAHADGQRTPRPFDNAPDTDWSLARNRAVLATALDAVATRPPGPVVAVVDGEAVEGPLTGTGIDPSVPDGPWYRYVQADAPTVERAVAAARRGAERWRATAAAARAEVLEALADVMEAERARVIATMVADGGKVVREADPEVSEAVDAARYAAGRARVLDGHHGPAGTFAPYGVVVVAPPWNFPYAIPAGGVTAALAAGNAVILKPAPETVLTAAVLFDQCRRAGVPGDVLQFLPCADDDSGRRLVTHPGVDAVVLTGAFETARRFIEWRPDMVLHAETSGKNAFVITGAADQTDAVRDLVHAAFSHAGQKCSAASIAIVEAPVHDDPRFFARLADAVSSLAVGRAADLATRMGPLIRPPAGPLERALTELEPGERWLVRPRQVGNNPRLWSPGVKVGVRAGSLLHTTECFGPVLGVMRATDLDEALALQNATGYGLTGGISSLDETEIARWLDAVEVGNAYVNRHTTGAVVRRQPFGGWKRSSIGPGAKAGGPNYVASLGTWRRVGAADVAAEREAARRAAERLLAGEDPSALAAEQNLFRLRPLRRAGLRLGSSVDGDALELAAAVAADLGVGLEVSTPVPLARPPAGVPVVVEDGEACADRWCADPPPRVRLDAPDPALRGRLLDAGTEVDELPLLALGTYELLRWTHEQAVSRTMHRHGNIVRPRDQRRSP